MDIRSSLRTKDSLFTAYLPFIKNGGLFIETPESYDLGQILHLSLRLMDEEELYLIQVKVIWITPVGAQAQKDKAQGIGVQFLGENSEDLVNKIESYLEELLQSVENTDTI